MKSAKILFINPRSANKDALPIPPLGILYLAAFLRDKGYKNIEVLDNNLIGLTETSLFCVIARSDIVCVTGTTSQYPEAATIAKLAKESNKISISGGPHASSAPEDMIKKAGFDYVVMGEGELALFELLETIENKSSNFDLIPGISFSRDGEIVKTKKKFIKNIDELPFPARDLIDMSKYGNKELKRFNGKYTHMMSSRGCGSKCTFCCSPVMWRSCRLASAERVFEEMMFLRNNYGIKNIHFQDDNFTIHKKRVMKICDLILGSGVDFKWSCQTRPTAVDEEVMSKMAEAGCVQVEFGVESGDNEILRKAKKKYTTDQIKHGFDLARKAGINTYGFFVVGLPGETLRSWIKSIIFAKKLRLDSSVWTVLIPYPGTEIYDDRLVKILDNDYANWLYKRPVIKSGIFGPRSLNVMRWIADKVTNGLFNSGTYKKD